LLGKTELLLQSLNELLPQTVKIVVADKLCEWSKNIAGKFDCLLQTVRIVAGTT